MNLNELNQLTRNDSGKFFSYCCAANNWVEKMSQSRPYENKQTLMSFAKEAWEDMHEADFLQAFDAHPMIGDLSSLREKYQSTLKTAGNEQSGTKHADETVLRSLHQLNHQYLEKFGFIFIICATGLSAEQMLSELQKRIHNSREQELVNAAQQQINISLLRLKHQLTDTIEGESN